MNKGMVYRGAKPAWEAPKIGLGAFQTLPGPGSRHLQSTYSMQFAK